MVQVDGKLHNMTRLSKKQIQNKINFIKNYCKAKNAADGSIFDPNSNVTHKNIATLNAEINKEDNIQVKRALVYEFITNRFGKKIANKYIKQLEQHDIYCHDESMLAPYCVAISMYPFLLEGLKNFGGETKQSKHLSSYNGGFVNLVYALSSQFCGAVATVEYLLCFDYFARKDYGDDYLNNYKHIIEQELQEVVYSLNQPASARGYQSVFWNISIFDKPYFDSLFGNFIFPDGTKPNWDTFNKLQKFFMKWFNKERTKAILTFPVITVTLLNKDNEIVDKEYLDFVSQELSEGNAFFIYTSNSVDSLSSCCRLRNDITDQINDFSYSLGAGGVMTGSMNVITLNMNRFIQNIIKKDITYTEKKHLPIILQKLKNQIKVMHKYQIAFKDMYSWFKNNNMLPAYEANFINMDKQYLTIGINGLLEGAEYLGYSPTNNKEYKTFIGKIFKLISDTNKETCKEYSNLKLNCEQVPAESVGVKFAKWDKKDGYIVPRDCYNSYLYRVEDENITVLDKFSLHGNDTLGLCDGGSALHVNLESYPTKEAFNKLIHVAVKEGCPYFCFNIKVTICNDCGYINKETKQYCIKCNSSNIDYGTRVIGYLKRVSNFSKERQLEESKRYYHCK